MSEEFVDKLGRLVMRIREKQQATKKTFKDSFSLHELFQIAIL